MKTWKITRRTTDDVVHVYTSDSPVDWPDYPFAQFNHIAGAVSEAAPQATNPDRELTKYAWRLLFTDSERQQIDRFNATFEVNPNLTEAQRDGVRSGLEDYKAATLVDKDNPATADVLGLYVMLGVLEPNRPAEILA